ncbi:hypothetical protein FJD14_23695, partial [Escherichia coli]|nr:hypothetical protein [Escherichia coli]
EGPPQETSGETSTPSAEPTAYDIHQNDSLTHGVNQLGAMHKDLSKELKDAWNTWLEELHHQVHVDDKTLNLQKNTNKFDDIASDYERRRLDFENLTQSKPVSDEKIHQIKALSIVFCTLPGMLPQDCPSFLQAFFNGGNGKKKLRKKLRAMAPEVLEWLTG